MRMGSWFVGVVVGTGLAAIACGSSESTGTNGGASSGAPAPPPPGTPPSAAGWAGVCDKAQQRALTCGGPAFNRATCDSSAACYPLVLRAELVGPLGDCVGSRPCSQSIEACYSDAVKPYQNDPAFTKFLTDCLARKDVCSGGFADDYCAEGVLWTPSVLATWSACLAKDCTQIKACFDGAVGPGCKL